MIWQRLSFIAACLVLPIVWGLIVHRLFEYFRSRSHPSPREGEAEFPDFQI